MSSNKRKSGGASGDPAFESWLARQLHKVYDDVLAEEVPAELLRVVDRAARKSLTAPDEVNGVANSAADPTDKPVADPPAKPGPAKLGPAKPGKAKRDRR